MKALDHPSYGPADVLRVVERPRPTARPGQLLVRVRAVEVTKADTELRSLRFPVGWFALPMRLAMGLRRPRRCRIGVYYAGEVVEVGEGVTRFSPGDRVFGTTGLRQSVCSEFVAVPEGARLARLPEGVDFDAGAASLLGGLNALHFLTKAGLRAGETLLVIGAGGSIGALAVQLGVHLGAEVTAVDVAAKRPLLERLGAQRVLTHPEQRWGVDRAPAKGYDVILEMPARKQLARSLRALAPGGRLMIANLRSIDLLAAVFLRPGGGRRLSCAMAKESARELERVGELLATGALAPPIDRRLPLEAVVEAHRRVESERRRGIVLLTP